MMRIRPSSDSSMPISGRIAGIDRRGMLLGAATGLGVLAAGGTVLLRGTPAFAAPRADQPAPTFSATDTNGTTWDLAALSGSVVVLEWTNADCPFVRKHYGSANMQTLQKDITGAGGIWLSVISSAPGQQGHVDAATANELTASRDAAPSGVILDADGSLGRTYGAQTTPHMFVIDGEGLLRYMGGIDSISSTQVSDVEEAQPYLREAFFAVHEGRSVEQAVTRPYGCAVHYGTA